MNGSQGFLMCGDVPIVNPIILIDQRNKNMESRCEGCGNVFIRQHGKHPLYCSKKCFHENRKKKGVFLTCKICGKLFYRKQSATKNAQYCSRTCLKIAPKAKIKTACDICGIEFLRYPSSLKWAKIRNHSGQYCSKKCSDMASIGKRKNEKSPLWKGGISRAYKYGYHSSEYKQWHNEVFKRDDYTCQICNTRGGYLHAHHIKGFSQYPDLRFIVSNGITLCKNCHMEVHSKLCVSQNKKKTYLNQNAMEDRKKIKYQSLIKDYLPRGEMPV